jgi:serine O-acetyltransferase
MIRTKEDLKRYMAMDKYALNRKRERHNFFRDPIWTYEVYLRMCEYYLNTTSKNPLKLLHKMYYKFAHKWLGILLGFSIPYDVCGGGLRINHVGTIVINSNVRIGEFLDIHADVNIGQGFNGDKIHDVPRIGSNVWIGPGAKLYGAISIGNEVMIGANAVVNKSFEQSNVVIAGVPATIVREKCYPMKRAFKENQ